MEGGEVHRVGALDDGDDEPAAAVFPLNVDRQAKGDPVGNNPEGRAVLHDEGVSHHGVLLGCLNERVGDQMGERDLPGRPAGLQTLVDPRLRSSSTPTARTRKRRGGRDGQALLHVRDELGGGALDGGRSGWERPDWGRGASRGRGSGGRQVPSLRPAFRCGLDGISPLPPIRPLPTMPLSKSRRQSGPTVAGSFRNSSYMACAKPALAVSNTFGSTRIHHPLRLGHSEEARSGQTKDNVSAVARVLPNHFRRLGSEMVIHTATRGGFMRRRVRLCYRSGHRSRWRLSQTFAWGCGGSDGGSNPNPAPQVLAKAPSASGDQQTGPVSSALPNDLRIVVTPGREP